MHIVAHNDSMQCVYLGMDNLTTLLIDHGVPTSLRSEVRVLNKQTKNKSCGTEGKGFLLHQI